MGTWIVGAVVLAMVVLAARKVYKDREKNDCGCGCGGCCNGGRPAKRGDC
jgi:hypothetical protein